MTTPLPIGVQLYAVRDDCAKDLSKTFATLAKAGYQGVEFAGYYGNDAKKLRALLDQHGLRCCGAHIGIQTLMSDALKATIDFNHVIGNRFLIIPGLSTEYNNSKAAWLKTAALVNDISIRVKSAGMQVGYHAHAGDFKKIEGEEPWNLFFTNTNQDVVMQMDTGNCMDGGGDPVSYLKKFAGRARTIHMKEYSAKNPNAIVGEGDVKWNEVINLCHTVGKTEWFIIEQETGSYPPLETAERSLKNLKEMIAGKKAVGAESGRRKA